MTMKRLLRYLLILMLPIAAHAQTNTIWLPGSTQDNTVIARNNFYVNGTSNLGGLRDTTGSVTGLPINAVRTRPQDSLIYVYNGRASGRKWYPISTAATAGVVSIAVNGGSPQSGALTLTIPTNNNQLTNGNNYITAAGAPVQSVNGQINNVTIDGSIVHVTGDATFINVTGNGTITTPFQVSWIGAKVDSLWRTPGKDSIQFMISGRYHSILDSLGSAGSGLLNLNGLTTTTQSFAIGTSGTAPNWVSITATHTLNIPNAATGGVTLGGLSNTDYSSFSSKLPSALVSGNIFKGSVGNIAVAAPDTERLVTIYTCTWWGILPDGVTNWTHQIAVALAYIQANGGGNLYFPGNPNTYRYDSIALPSLCGLMGDGYASQLKLNDHSNRNGITLQTPTTFKTTIRDLTLNGNGNNQDSANIDIIYFNGATSGVPGNDPCHYISHLFLISAANNSIEINGRGGNYVSKIKSINAGIKQVGSPTGGHGILVNCIDSHFDGLDLGAGAGTALEVLGSSNRFSNLKLWNSGSGDSLNAYGLYCFQAADLVFSSTNTQANEAHGSVFDHCNDILFHGTNSLNGASGTFTGGFPVYANQSGVVITASHSVSVYGDVLGSTATNTSYALSLFGSAGSSSHNIVYLTARLVNTTALNDPFSQAAANTILIQATDSIGGGNGTDCSYIPINAGYWVRTGGHLITLTPGDSLFIGQTTGSAILDVLGQTNFTFNNTNPATTNAAALNLTIRNNAAGGSALTLAGANVGLSIGVGDSLNIARPFWFNISNPSGKLISAYGFYSGGGSLGNVTNYYEYTAADATLSGAGNLWGFRSDITAGTGKAQIYAQGTALSYFGGNVNLGNPAGATSAQLYSASTTQAWRPPTMSGAQMNAIGTPVAGDMVVCSDSAYSLCIFNTTTSSWLNQKAIGGGGSGSPAGSSTWVQYNSSGLFGAVSTFTFASGILSAPNLTLSSLSSGGANDSIMTISSSGVVGRISRFVNVWTNQPLYTIADTIYVDTILNSSHLSTLTATNDSIFTKDPYSYRTSVISPLADSTVIPAFRQDGGTTIRVKGKLISMWGAWPSAIGDNSPTNVVQSVSYNNGLTWSFPIIKITPPTGYFAVQNPSAGVLDNGNLIVFCTMKAAPGAPWGNIFEYISADTGNTFTLTDSLFNSPVGTYQYSSIDVLSRSQRTGRWLLPFAVQNPGHPGAYHGMLAYSDNNWATKTISSAVITSSDSTLAEPHIVPLIRSQTDTVLGPEKLIYMWSSGFDFEAAQSLDNGVTFGATYHMNLSSPEAAFHVRSIWNETQLVILANRFANTATTAGQERKKMELITSIDGESFVDRGTVAGWISGWHFFEPNIYYDSAYGNLICGMSMMNDPQTRSDFRLVTIPVRTAIQPLEYPKASLVISATANTAGPDIISFNMKNDQLYPVVPTVKFSLGTLFGGGTSLVPAILAWGDPTSPTGLYINTKSGDINNLYYNGGFVINNQNIAGGSLTTGALLKVENNQAVKFMVMPGGNAIVADSLTIGNLRTGTTADSVIVWDAVYHSLKKVSQASIGGGGGGNTNSNIGSGYRLAIPGTNNIKTLFCSGCTLDSMSNANGITLTVTSSGGTPGGSTTQFQYNNAGAFGGIAGATTDGTNIFIPALNGSSSSAGSLTLASTTNGTLGKIFLGAAQLSYYDEANKFLKISTAAIGGTLGVNNGIYLLNPTAATSSVSQNTASFTIGSFGWQTTTPASEEIDWSWEGLTFSGTTHPTGTMNFYPYINGVRNTNPAMSITSLGNVGFGTQNPIALLQVENDVNGNSLPFVIVNSNAGSSALSGMKYTNDASNAVIEYASSGNSAPFISSLLFQNNSSTGGFVFRTNGSTNRGYMSQAGNLDWGTVTDVTNVLFLIASTTKSSIPAPIMTTSQAGSISTPASGSLVILSDSSNRLSMYNGTKFITFVTSDMLGAVGVSVVGSFSGSSHLNGAVISGNTITFSPADGTNPGMVSITTQTFAGAKTVSSDFTFQAGIDISGWNGITTGTSSTIPPGFVNTLFNPSSAIATYTLTLPASPADGMLVKIHFGGTLMAGVGVVTVLTISANSGQTLVQTAAPTTGLAGNCFIYQYNLVLAQWYREQ